MTKLISQTELRADICKKSFEQFVRRFWDQVPGAGKMVWGWHMSYMCQQFQKIAERVFEGLPREHDVVLNISPGTSKPVWEGMPVMMADGTWKPLRRIKVGDMVIGKSGNPCRVSAVHKQGIQLCVKITTIGGRSIVAAKDHPILTADGWINAGQIQNNQMLALMHRPVMDIVSDRSLDEFALAGYLIGDGSVSGGNCCVTGKDPDYIQDFIECASRLGFGYRIAKQSNGIVSVHLKNKEGSVPSRIGKYKGKGRGYKEPTGPRKWIIDVGLKGKTSRTKEIPDFVWNGSNEQIVRFLASYFHCDGCVSYKDKGKRNICISVCTVSYKLARGLQKLMLRVGINMRLKKYISSNGYTYNRGLTNYKYYIVCTTDQDSAARFLETIPIQGPKKRKLEGYSPKKRLFEQDYLPDRVESVEEVGGYHCRCLTVEDDASFVVDGVVVHNSTIISILGPAWIWARMPEARIITASHTESLVLDLSNKARFVIESEMYQQHFPEVQLRDDQNTKEYYANTKGGDRKTCTVGGKSPMGFHAHFIIIDDPIDPKKTLSEAELMTAREFITDVIPSRKVDKAISVTFLVMQRLGVGDPTDVMLDGAEKEGASPVEHICIPSDLDKDENNNWITTNVKPEQLVSYYTDGLMDPRRLPKSVLDEYKARGALYYWTQFRQAPYARGGQMFKQQYFNLRVKAAPHKARRIRYWDRACLIPGTLVETKRGHVPIEMVNEGDLVLTRKGYRRVNKSWKTKEVGRLTAVLFSNGSIIIGTGDHPVWTENRYWVDLSTLKWDDYILCSCGFNGEITEWLTKSIPTLKRLSLMELGSQERRMTNQDTSGQTSGIRKIRDTFTSLCTEQCGSTIMGISPLAIISITKIKTNPITQLRILNASLQRNMQQDILMRFVTKALSTIQSILKRQGEHGISGYGIGKNTRGNVFNVESNLQQNIPILPELSIVQGRVDGDTIPVYDLEIDDAHEFFANGVLVHNSTSGGGCNTAGVLLSADDDNYFVEHCVAGQWEPTERNQIILSTALMDRARYGPNQEPVIWIEREGGSSGRDAWKGIARVLAGFHVKEDTVTGDKATRAEPWSSQLASGNVYLVDDGTWDVLEYIKEHMSFPGGFFKDRVDASSGAFNLLVKATSRRSPFRTYTLLGKRLNKPRVIVCAEEELALFTADQPTLLISICDPGYNPPPPKHGFSNLIDCLVIPIADLDPAELQDVWNDSIPPTNKKPSELIMSDEDGKTIWRFLRKKRNEIPMLFVFQDKGDEDRRALSLAHAFCSVSGLPVKETIYFPAEPYNIHEGEAPNKHLYHMVRHCRSMVL